MRDFVLETPWRLTHELTAARMTYGFTTFPSNPGPYFTLTGEEWKAKKGKSGEVLPTGRDCLSCGQLHGLTSLFSELAPAVKWHLFDPLYGPMHYAANALYWRDHYVGKLAFRPGDGVAPGTEQVTALKRFESVIVWGALRDEIDARTLITLSAHEVQQALERRLPALRKAFVAEVAQPLKLVDLLSEALQLYGHNLSEI